jgi:hypothetical protein
MPHFPSALDQDFEVVERRTDVRIVLSLPGRFTLASRRDMEGERREFPCRLLNMSCHALGLMTPVSAQLGERVIAHIEEFGRFEGPIVRQLEGGFIIQLIMPKAERIRLAGRIEWYDKYKNHDVANLRAHTRIVPRSPHSTIVLADGTTMDCLIKDVSASGAAVDSDLIPPLGTPVAIGQIVGRVVRIFDQGFAVRFVKEQDPQTVDALIARLH